MKMPLSGEGFIFSTRCHGFLFNILGIIFRLRHVRKEETDNTDGTEENVKWLNSCTWMQMQLKRLTVACWIERWKEKLHSPASGLQIPPLCLHIFNCICYFFWDFPCVNFHRALYCTFIALVAILPPRVSGLFFFFFCGGKKSYKIKHMQSNELFAMPVFSLAHVSAVHSCICMTLSVRVNVHRWGKICR